MADDRWKDDQEPGQEQAADDSVVGKAAGEDDEFEDTDDELDEDDSEDIDEVDEE
jgi:hypothetical protein